MCHHEVANKCGAWYLYITASQLWVETQQSKDGLMQGAHAQHLIATGTLCEVGEAAVWC